MAGHGAHILLAPELIRSIQNKANRLITKNRLRFIVAASGRLLTLPEFARRNSETEHPTRVISHTPLRCSNC